MDCVPLLDMGRGFARVNEQPDGGRDVWNIVVTTVGQNRNPLSNQAARCRIVHKPLQSGGITNS